MEFKELYEVGALNATRGWSERFIDEVVWKQILEPLSNNPPILPIAVAMDCRVAMNQRFGLPE